MPLGDQGTPCRAGYSGVPTQARSPHFVAGHRAELRSAMAALRDPLQPAVSAVADGVPEQTSVPAWPDSGPTVPVAPAFTAIRVRRGQGGDDAGEEDVHRANDDEVSDGNGEVACFTPLVQASTSADSTTSWHECGPTRPYPPSRSVPRASVASGNALRTQKPPTAQARQSQPHSWRGRTVARSPVLTTTSRTRKSVAVAAGEDPLTANLPARRAPSAWTGAGTIPRAPTFAAGRPPRPVSVAEPAAAAAPKPARSALERRAAFERLTRPRAKPTAAFTYAGQGGGALPKSGSAPVIRGEARRAIFERLTRPRQGPGDQGDSAAEDSGRLRSSALARAPAAAFRGHSAAANEVLQTRPSSSRFPIRTASNPSALRERSQNVPSQSYVPGRTVPKPFRLMSVELHDAATAKFEERVKRESVLMDQKRRYHAVPLRADMLEGPTFQPTLAPPDQVVTVAEDSFCRQSDMRAASRADFEERTKARIEEDDAAKQEAAAAREAKLEHQRLAQYNERRFRARPAPKFREEDATLPPVPPPLAPTSPHTPHFAPRTRRMHTRSMSRLRKPDSESEGGLFDNPFIASPENGPVHSAAQGVANDRKYGTALSVLY